MPELKTMSVHELRDILDLLTGEALAQAEGTMLRAWLRSATTALGEVFDLVDEYDEEDEYDADAEWWEAGDAMYHLRKDEGRYE